jgi:hypothetical protein
MQNGSHFLLSEVLRIKGEVLVRMKDRNSKQIESLFRSAVHTAAEQNAPLPALRAATSLARFLSSQHRRAEAHAVLQPRATLIASLAGTQDATWAAEFA